MYMQERAAAYWNCRNELDRSSLQKVLYFDECELVNKAYDSWEKEVILSRLKNRKIDNALDFPVGNGRWGKVLCFHCSNLYCVDISSSMIESAKKIIPVNAVQYYTGSLHDFACDTLRFDMMLCTGLFEHLPKDEQIKLIKRFSQIVVDSGLLILVINNSKSRLLKTNDDNRYRKSTQLHNGYYAGISEYEEIKKALIENGFRISSVATNPFFSVVRRLNKEGVDSAALSVLLKKAVTYDLTNYAHLDSNQTDIVAEQVIFFCSKVALGQGK